MLANKLILMTLSAAALAPALFAARFDEKVRNDFFAGFAGDRTALERGMRVSGEMIAQDPNGSAEALAWHGGGLMFQAGQKFQQGDVAAGGEGAPLAPIYHLARARAGGLSAPLAALNIGGVANVTFWTGGDDIAAFDTGPGNGMIDLMLQARGAGRFDEGGRYASVGRVEEGVLAGFLGHPYFRAPPPKSLDRYDFSLEPLNALSVEDAAATLVAFMAEAVKAGFEMMGAAPTEVIVCGGGRHNPEIMKALAARLTMPVRTAEDHGWRGDAIEAEAFAYLAARTAKGLPISFPKTTGVAAAMTGGRIARP